MPEPVPQPQPQAQPSAGAAPATGQPPFGSSPATGPTQNAGYTAAGAKQLGVLIDGMVMVLQLVGANSEPGQALLDAIKKLGRFVPPGSVTPADKMSVLQQLMIKAQQSGQQMKTMQAGGQPGQGGGAAPQQPMHAAA